MLKVLVIEDNEDHFLLVETALFTAASGKLTVQHETELRAGIEALKTQVYDICFFDLKLPDASIETTAEALNELTTETPIIVLSSHVDTDLAKSLLRHGVQDYLPKEDISPTLLNRMTIYAIERKKQQIDLQKRHGDMQTFCASLSHDFNGHIRRIRNFSKIIKASLARKTELDPDELKSFQIIEDNTTNLMDLVDGLGHFLTADHANLQIQTVDLSALIQNLSKLILENSEKEVKLSITGDFPTIQGSESQLTMMFQNLITNAVKYSNGSALVLLEGRVDQTTQRCEIAVQDHGIGIDSKYFQQIFAPFNRLHSTDEYSGAGLGLSIVTRIVERHKGTLRLESEPGQGSTFFVSLPLMH